MDKDFCQLIDRDDLVEKYIEGKLHGEILNKFTQHLSECEAHARAVSLERALQRGVRDFARSELKSNLRHQIKKHEISRYYILRYAAILIVAIMAPILLYYQFVIKPETPQFAREEIHSPVQLKEQVPVQDKEKVPAPEKEQLPAPESVQMVAESPQIPLQESTRSASKPAKLAARKQANRMLDARAENEELIIIPPAQNMQDSIFTYIKNQEAQLFECFPDDVKAQAQNFMLQFKLDADGTITNIRFYPPDLFTQKYQNCMEEKIRTWKLPQLQMETEIRKKIDL
jgi:hypothetical protein